MCGSGRGPHALPPSLRHQPRATLGCLALLPAWGSVTWAEGSFKHKTAVGKTVAGTFSHHPVRWRRRQAAAVKSEVPCPLPSWRQCQLLEAASATVCAGCRHSPCLLQPPPGPGVFSIVFVWAGPALVSFFLPSDPNLWHLLACHPKQETAYALLA